VTAHTSNPLLLSDEFRYIIHKFLRNGFPLHLISRYTNYYWAQKEPPHRPLPTTRIFLPHFSPSSRISHNAARQIDCQLIEQPAKSIGASLLPPQPPRIQTPANMQRDIIYGIPCLDCNNIYIGQTKQTLKARINHHKSEFKHMCSNNSLVQHYSTTGHTPNFAHLHKFYSQPNFRTRLNLEAICIAVSSLPVSNHILPQLPYLHKWIDLIKAHNISITPAALPGPPT